MCEEDKLFSSIVDAVDDMIEAEDIEKGEAAETESQTSATSDHFPVMANCKISSDNEDKQNSVNNRKEIEDQDKYTTHRKRRRKAPVLAQNSNGLARFWESMRAIEVAKVYLQAKLLAFEEICHEDLMRELR